MRSLFLALATIGGLAGLSHAADAAPVALRPALAAPAPALEATVPGAEPGAPAVQEVQYYRRRYYRHRYFRRYRRY